MKKILLVLSAMVVALMMFAGPANATGGHSGDRPDADNKKVTLCHATGSEKNPYNKITVSVSSFYDRGHADHENDIFEQIIYTTKAGDTVIIPAQGDTSLLAFDDCEKPRADAVVVPDFEVDNKCGTVNDRVYVVQNDQYDGVVTYNDNVATIVFTAKTGYTFAEGKAKTVTYAFADDADLGGCELPETGGKETAAGIGIVALVAMAGAGVMLLRTRRKTV